MLLIKIVEYDGEDYCWIKNSECFQLLDAFRKLRFTDWIESGNCGIILIEFCLAFNDEHSRKRKVKNIEKISSRAPSKPDSNLFVSAKWFHHLSAYSNILFIFYENTFCLSIDSVRCHSITQPAKGKKMFSLKESYTGVDVNIGWSRRKGRKVNEKWFKFRCLFHSVCVFHPARYFLSYFLL